MSRPLVEMSVDGQIRERSMVFEPGDYPVWNVTTISWPERTVHVNERCTMTIVEKYSAIYKQWRCIEIKLDTAVACPDLEAEKYRHFLQRVADLEAKKRQDFLRVVGGVVGAAKLQRSIKGMADNSAADTVRSDDTALMKPEAPPQPLSWFARTFSWIRRFFSSRYRLPKAHAITRDEGE